MQHYFFYRMIIIELIIYRMNSSITSLSPTPRNGKHGWYDQFQKHNFLLNNIKVKMLIVGDSLVSNLPRYPEIQIKYFINHKVQLELVCWYYQHRLFGIAGDKAQNVLSRVNNLRFSSDLNLKYVFILCDTNILITILLSLLLAPSFPLVWRFKR